MGGDTTINLVLGEGGGCRRSTSDVVVFDEGSDRGVVVMGKCEGGGDDGVVVVGVGGNVD